MNYHYQPGRSAVEEGNHLNHHGSTWIDEPSRKGTHCCNFGLVATGASKDGRHTAMAKSGLIESDISLHTICIHVSIIDCKWKGKDLAKNLVRVPNVDQSDVECFDLRGSRLGLWTYRPITLPTYTGSTSSGYAKMTHEPHIPVAKFHSFAAAACFLTCCCGDQLLYFGKNEAWIFFPTALICKEPSWSFPTLSYIIKGSWEAIFRVTDK